MTVGLIPHAIPATSARLPLELNTLSVEYMAALCMYIGRERRWCRPYPHHRNVLKVVKPPVAGTGHLNKSAVSGMRIIT